MLTELASRYPFGLPLGGAIFATSMIGYGTTKLILEPRFTTTDADKARNKRYVFACNGLSLLAAGLIAPFFISSPLLLAPAFLYVLAVAVIHVWIGYGLARDAPPIDGTMMLLFAAAGPTGPLVWAFFQLA